MAGVASEEISSVSEAASSLEELEADGQEQEEPEPEFYDPGLDDKDEAWVAGRRQGRKSDAVLSCPCCFTTLCIDCQRHELYVNRYRAMFVVNCRVVQNEVVRSIPSTRRQKKRPRRGRRDVEEARESSSVEGEGGEVYKPVRCAECDAEVGVLDGDEVYHFVDTLPSYS